MSERIETAIGINPRWNFVSDILDTESQHTTLVLKAQSRQFKVVLQIDSGEAINFRCETDVGPTQRALRCIVSVSVNVTHDYGCTMIFFRPTENQVCFVFR